VAVVDLVKVGVGFYCADRTTAHAVVA